MNKKIPLALAALMVAAMMVLPTRTAAARRKNDPKVRITAAETLRYISNGYYGGYENLNSALGIELYPFRRRILAIGLRADGPNVHRDNLDLTVSAGLRLGKGFFDVTPFAAVQRGVAQEEGDLTLAGGGLAITTKLIGPVRIRAEASAMNPVGTPDTHSYKYAYIGKTVLPAVTMGLSVNLGRKKQQHK